MDCPALPESRSLWSGNSASSPDPLAKGMSGACQVRPSFHESATPCTCPRQCSLTPPPARRTRLAFRACMRQPAWGHESKQRTQRALIVGVQRTGTAPRRGASGAELCGLRELDPQFPLSDDNRVNEELGLPLRSDGAKGECLLRVPAYIRRTCVYCPILILKSKEAPPLASFREEGAPQHTRSHRLLQN